MSQPQLIGIDIGGTKSAILLGDAQGNILRRQQWLTAQTPTPAALIEKALQIIHSFNQPIQSAGVSIGGPLDSKQGTILSPPNLPGWDAIPLKSILQKALSVPVTVMHDAAACALAEQRWGMPTATRLAYLTCGTGFGAGFVFDGKPYLGANGRSPEIGHIRWKPDGPTAFGKRGSAEAYASGSGLKGLAQFLFPLRWPNGCEGPELASLAESNDPQATQVLSENAKAVGGICAMLADTLALDHITLGSLSRYLGKSWIEQVQTIFNQEVLPSAATACLIAPAVLGDRLQDCSAIAAALIL